MRKLLGNKEQWFQEVSTIQDGVAAYMVVTGKDKDDPKKLTTALQAYDAGKDSKIMVSFSNQSLCFTIQSAIALRDALSEAIAEVEQDEADKIIKALADGT